MWTISVTEFKAHCLELIDEVNRTGEALILTKRGKPSAMLTLPPPEPEKRWVLGQFRGKGRIVGEIVAPLDEPWDALV